MMYKSINVRIFISLILFLGYVCELEAKRGRGRLYPGNGGGGIGGVIFFLVIGFIIMVIVSNKEKKSEAKVVNSHNLEGIERVNIDGSFKIRSKTIYEEVIIFFKDDYLFIISPYILKRGIIGGGHRIYYSEIDSVEYSETNREVTNGYGTNIYYYVDCIVKTKDGDRFFTFNPSLEHKLKGYKKLVQDIRSRI